MPKQFIDILHKYKENNISEIENILVEIANSPSNIGVSMKKWTQLS